MKLRLRDPHARFSPCRIQIPPIRTIKTPIRLLITRITALNTRRIAHLIYRTTDNPAIFNKLFAGAGAATSLLQVSTGLRKATPAVVVTAKRVRYPLQLSLEISNAGVRRNHVFNDNHFPWMGLDNICQSDGRSIALSLKLLRKLLSPYLVGKY